MAAVTASMVKELRERTGLGMMECKKALVGAEGDIERAIDDLRKSGQAKAAKKAGRTAAEGVVVVATTEDRKRAVMVEINSETDFVARNGEFQAMVAEIADIALGCADTEALLSADMGGKSVADTVTDKVATIGENMAVRRMARYVEETK